MGGVKDKYLKYEAAGDQYVGRCASGLNQLRKEFAVTPAYFDFFGEINDEVEREKLKKDLQKWLEIIVPNFGGVLPLTQHLIQFFFPSMCYHHGFLDKHLHADCSLRALEFLKDIPSQFTKIVKVSYPWDNDGTNACIPNCSGIPPHVMILAEVEHIRNELKVLRDQIKDYMNSVIMDERGVEGNEFHTNSILKAIEDSVQKMQDKLIKAVVANSNGGGGNIYEHNGSYDGDSAPNLGGVAFIENEDDDGGFDFNDITNRQLDRGGEVGALEREKISEAKLKLEKRRLTVGFHHGHLQVVPVYWTFPNMTIKQLVDNWFIGNEREKITPFAVLQFNNIAHIKTSKSARSRKSKLRQMRSVMKVVKKCAIQEGCWSDDKSKWDVQFTFNLWNKIRENYITALYGGEKQNAEIHGRRS